MIYDRESTKCQVCGISKMVGQIACRWCYNDEVAKRVSQLPGGMRGKERDQARLNICLDVYNEKKNVCGGHVGGGFASTCVLTKGHDGECSSKLRDVKVTKYPTFVACSSCMVCGATKSDPVRIACDKCLSREGVQKALSKLVGIPDREDEKLRICIDAYLKEGRGVAQFRTLLPSITPAPQECYKCGTAAVESRNTLNKEGWRIKIDTGLRYCGKCVCEIAGESMLKSSEARTYQYPPYVHRSLTCQCCGGEKDKMYIACESCWAHMRKTYPTYVWCSEQGALNKCIDAKLSKVERAKKPNQELYDLEVHCHSCDRFTTVNQDDDKGWTAHPIINNKWVCPDCKESAATAREVKKVSSAMKYGFSHRKECVADVTIAGPSVETRISMPISRIGRVQEFQLRKPKPKIIMMVDDQSEPP